MPRGVPLCEAVLGPSAAWLSLAAAAGVAWLVAASHPADHAGRIDDVKR